MASKFQLLTRSRMRNLKANEKIIERGIIFERLTNSDGRFSINVMVDGKRIHRVVGKESEGVTRKQAEDLIAKLKTDAREQRLNLPKGRKIVFSFELAAEKYLRRLEQENGKDLEKKVSRLKHHLVPFFKDTPLSHIDTSSVEKFKKYRAENNAKAGTINRELATLSHLLNKALEWKWIDYKACKISRLPEGKGRITYLTTEQVHRLVESAKRDNCPHIYLFILIGLETSMRRMEILSIRLEHIDLNRQIIYIPKAKSGAREQPITKNLADYLSLYISQLESKHAWLFPTTHSSTGHIMNIEKPFRRVVEQAGLDPKEVVRHTLRHTAITHLVQAGIDLPTVQRISGHKTLQMVVRYSHQNGEHIRTAMDALEKRYRQDN